jgi:hypothetical protein
LFDSDLVEVLDIDQQFAVGWTELKHYLDNPSLAKGQRTYREQLPFRNQMVKKSADGHRRRPEALGLLFVEKVSQVRAIIYGAMYVILYIGSLVGVIVHTATTPLGGGNYSAVIGEITGTFIGGALLGISIRYMLRRPVVPVAALVPSELNNLINR